MPVVRIVVLTLGTKTGVCAITSPQPVTFSESVDTNFADTTWHHKLW